MSTSNGAEVVLVYAGPTISREKILKEIPDAVVLPPARQGDVITHLHRFNPAYVLLIDGEFRQSLSTWHKELVYALMYPGVKKVCGSSSMGALRAADLAELGMFGIGKIFEWYWEGVLEDDAEVAVNYTVDGQGNYRSTVALVDVRAADPDESTFQEAKAVPWWERWDFREHANQKEQDAQLLLEVFRDLTPVVSARPTPEHLSELFLAQHERDRRIEVNGVEIPLQSIDATVALRAKDAGEIFWNATNRALVLSLADALGVIPTDPQVEAEGVKHCLRYGIELDGWLKNNGLNSMEFQRLMFQNARIRILQEALFSTRLVRRRTQDVLDYLRSTDAFSGWAQQAAEGHAAKEDLESGQLALNPEAEWRARCWQRGIHAGVQFNEFLREFGFQTGEELNVAMARDPFPR